ncbi:unnamed protein product [Phytomonas sp. EM1]|nr:unnamed protein product [Phytomonas sp. EM1]|eukprot:CCW63175.1 unnamed protein product [Phytomonas sp. isolate EM1]
MPAHERQSARSSYGMRAGFLGIDYVNAFSVVGALKYLNLTELHDENWTKYLPLGGLEHPHSQEITSFRSVGHFVVDLYQRAYAAHGNGIYTRLAVPRWVGGKRAAGTTHITLTPPLFAMKLRPIDTVGHTTRHVFPVLFHATDLEGGYPKIMKLEYASIGAPWLVPMLYDVRIKQQTMEYLASTPLILSTQNSIIRDSYHAKCGFPFGRIIRRTKGL